MTTLLTCAVRVWSFSVESSNRMKTSPRPPATAVAVPPITPPPMGGFHIVFDLVSGFSNGIHFSNPDDGTSLKVGIPFKAT